MQQSAPELNSPFRNSLAEDAARTSLLEMDDQSVGKAFDDFQHLSERLMGSYQALEQRVSSLSCELAEESEQRQQELSAKEQIANRLETLIESLPGGVVMLDCTGRIVESNPAAEALLEQDLLGKTWREIVGRCFEPQKDDGHEVSNRKGRRLSIETRSLANNEGQVILLNDLTETRRLQSAVSRNERLSALGKVASTLAHQVRTPLSTAMLYADHLCNETLPPENKQKFAEKLKGRLEFMERQVRDMLLFVKGEFPLQNTVSTTRFSSQLNEAVDGLIKSYQAECEWQVFPSEKVLRCHQDALMDAVLNLVHNALQASLEPELLLCIDTHHQFLEIDVLDNGPGIDEEKMQDMQELFVTTKAQGTGIGLSVVNHIAKSHGGELTLRSRQEYDSQQGLWAQLRLPIVQQ